jgi:F0F1-type ATP synthase assembly protein I
MYLIGAIVGGILIGWGIGNYLLDRYINETQDEINETPPKTKVNKK